MHAKIENWRCIEFAEFDLSNINIILGQNATGKSSLAYALYMLSKSAKMDAKNVIKMLYGLDAENFARYHGGKRYYPVKIEVNNSFVEINESDGNFNISHSKTSPWKEEYLLPAGRTAYFQALRFLSRVSEELKKDAETRIAIPFVLGFLKPILEELPMFPPAQMFYLDLNRVLTGFSTEPIKGELTTLGQYVVTITPLLFIFNFTYRDPFTDFELPAEAAPDGSIDSMILDIVLTKCGENSLIVIEEPEIYKNPVFQFEILEKISKFAIKKDLTIVMMTHSEIIPTYLAKLVETGTIKKDNVNIFYLRRNKTDPWTKINKIEIYEDGTLDELPDSEEVVARLF